MKNYTIDVRGVIAQAALETGWGKHFPTDYKTKKNSLNFFGIKWYEGWNSDHVTCETKEYNSLTGQYGTILTDFRAYKTIREGLEDYVSLIKRKYPQAWDGRNHYLTFVNGIVAGGWATSPTYKNSILSIVEKYLL